MVGLYQMMLFTVAAGVVVDALVVCLCFQQVLFDALRDAVVLYREDDSWNCVDATPATIEFKVLECENVQPPSSSFNSKEHKAKTRTSSGILSANEQIIAIETEQRKHLTSA
jgi:hypothetical protein